MMLKSLEAKINDCLFDVKAPISFLRYRPAYCDVCDTNLIHEDAAMWRLKYTLTGMVRQNLSSCISFPGMGATKETNHLRTGHQLAPNTLCNGHQDRSRRPRGQADETGYYKRGPVRKHLRRKGPRMYKRMPRAQGHKNFHVWYRPSHCPQRP